MSEGSFISQSGFRRLFDLNPLPMWLFDATSLEFIEVNETAIQHYGYSRDEFLSMTLTDIRPPEDLSKFRDFYRLAAHQPNITRYIGEWVHRKKNGDLISVEVTSHRFPTEGCESVLSVMHDVTARKKSDERLRESQERFRLLSDAAVEAIVIHKDFKIIEVNNTFLKLYGLNSATEALGRDPLEFVPEDYKNRVLRNILEGKTEPYEAELERRDGTRVHLEVIARSIKHGDGQARVVALHDITDRKRQERELRERETRLAASNRELEQFAYVTSHDLQEPLRMVASYVALLERNCKDSLDENSKEYVRFAVEGAKRMKQLIDDLLSFSMIGKKVLLPRSVDLNEVLDGVRFDLRLLVEETAARVELGELPPVLGDPSQLKQLFSNLVSNAIKFRGQKIPHIKIDSEKLGLGEWVVRVRDEGIGIDMQYAERIFRIFQRLHTADEYPGTGIGLAICKKIVERHGGKIWVQSEPNCGTTFYFTLPAVSASERICDERISMPI